MPPFLTPPPVPNPRTPTLKLPHGTVDCHMHLFDTRYPSPPDAKYVSADALPQTYIDIMDRFGIAMGVFIPASPHGTNPAHLVDVLRDYPDRFIGVAILGSANEEEIRKLDKAGVKGARFQSAAHGSKLPGFSAETAAKIHEFGWHAQLYPNGTEIIELEPLVMKLPNRVVFDHFASIPMDEAGLDQPAVKALFRLLDTGRVWVKLSRPDQISKKGKPWAASTTLAQALVKHAPERCLWGTDWPHVGQVNLPMPDDGDLVDLLLEWIPDEATRNRVLVDNPDEFYKLNGAAKRVPYKRK